MSNPLDHKPFRNVISGKGVKKRQRFKPNPLSGFGRGTDITVPKNKLAYPPGRHRLVFRAMLDGVKLIESLGAALSESKYDEASLSDSEAGIITVYVRNHGEPWKAIGTTPSKSEAINTALENAEDIVQHTMTEGKGKNITLPEFIEACKDQDSGAEKLGGVLVDATTKAMVSKVWDAISKHEKAASIQETLTYRFAKIAADHSPKTAIVELVDRLWKFVK